jgi:hypothetical protein
MSFVQPTRKPIACFVALALIALSISWAPAHAAMVNTAEILKENQHNLEPLPMSLDRSEVRRQLEAWGVTSEEAQAWVDGLTDQEIAEVAARIEQMPAGGSALGTLVGAGLVVFVILLITDILGYTDVFPFVKGR